MKKLVPLFFLFSIMSAQVYGQISITGMSVDDSLSANPDAPMYQQTGEQ